MRPFADDLLVLATQLLAAHTYEQVVDLTCRATQHLTGVERLYGSLSESTKWVDGVHQGFDGDDRVAVGPAHHSALFAAYRAASTRREPVTLTRPAFSAAIGALCGEEHALEEILAFPIIQRRGRLCGCLVLCLRTPLSEDATAVVRELARLAALAFDNVHRLSSARRYRERLNLLAEAAEEALWDWSPDTGEFWWGGGVQMLIGDVVVQSRLSWKFEQMHPDDVLRVRHSFDRALAAADAEIWRDEYRQRRTDGTWILVEDHAHILRDSLGRAHRVVGALRDVTERRALFAREQAARVEAERASAAKDEFLAMLGHELRNPLSPILSAVQLLQKRRDPEQLDRGLTIIDRQARHMTRLVDDLLDMARIANGKVLLERERMNPADAIDAALETTRQLFEERQHVIETRVARDLTIDADRARMEQVIGNLLTNAAKYTPPGGRITVDAQADDSFVHIRIADTGIGISADMLPRIFDMFVQDRQALDRTLGGLGLGLAIVSNLVKLHGGTVGVRSEGDGRGSEFVIRLPAASPLRAVDVSETFVDDRPFVPRRVLVVDDNHDAAESLAVGLVEIGHQTLVVHDGPAAVSAVDAFDPDVVLLDLGLPTMDGYAVARHVRERYGRRPRLIAVTGYGQSNDRRKTREAGFDMHLVKPVSFDRLQEAVADEIALPLAAGESTEGEQVEQ